MDVTTTTTPTTTTTTTTTALDALERIVHEGTVRRIVVKHEGEVVAEFPLAVGVVGAVLAAPLAAIAAIVALIADCTIEVERETADVEGPAPVEPAPIEPSRVEPVLAATTS
jgi:hypothetical protein